MKMCSRQDDYRMKMLRAGICIRCGQERLVTATLGEKCQKKMKLWTAKWRLKKQNAELQKELTRRAASKRN